MTSHAREPFGGVVVPQSDRIEAVADFVRRRALGLGAPEGVSPRHRSYRAHAARVLGWLGDDNRPTEAGEVLARLLPGPEQRAFVLASFERCPIVKRWMEVEGVDDVAALDPASARPFLETHSKLSVSTARRRAGTLVSWLTYVRPLPMDPLPALDRARRYLDGRDLPPPAVRFLDEAIAQRAPTRVANWARRNELVFFAELIRCSPTDLLQERNLGRRSIRQTDTLVRQATGLGWARLRELMGAGDGPAGGSEEDPTALTARVSTWDALRERCSPALREMPVEHLALPSRMLRFVCEPHGVATLGALLAWREADLLEIPKLGRRSIRDALRSLEELLASFVAPEPSSGRAVAPELPPPTVDELPDLLTHVKARIARLDPLDRLVLSRRVGLHGAVPTLGEVGDMIGVGRERVRQLEKRAAERIANEWWVPLVSERLSELVGDEAVTVEELERRDPLFADLADHQVAFGYLLARVFPTSLRLVHVGEQALVSSARPRDVAAALTEMQRAARQLDFPLPWDEAAEVARSSAEPLSSALVPWFVGELESLLATVDDGNGGRVATGYGWGIEARVLSVLEAADAPMTREALEEAVGTRCPRMPEKVIYVARGVVALPKHVPDFDLWGRRLVPLCIATMQEEDPGRQWSAVELLEALSDRAQLPGWLGHWHLASMLRLSDGVRYLGRLQVALDHEDAPEERQHLRDILVRLLEDARGPLTADELEARVHKVRGIHGATVRIALHQSPFFELRDGVFGLAPRDVPGGAEALAEALTAVEEELEARQQGMGPGEARELIRGLSDEHESWTLEMARSLARSHDSLRLNRSGGLGLSEWDDDRLPTRRELMRRLVAEAGGRVAVSAVQDQVESVFGTRPDRVQLANLASPLGLHLSADQLVAADLMLAEAPPPRSSLDPASLPGFPASAVPIFRSLLEETPRDLVVLRREAQRYVEAFEAACADHPHVDPEEARAAAAAIAKLIDTLGPEATDNERLMVQAAARYFVLTEDAESDFAVGGLDDDIAVINAVATHLGRRDCAVQLATRDHRPEWQARLPDEGVRRLFEHVFAHGVVTEPEAVFMLGSHRALRRFASRFDSLVARVPFDVRIDVVAGVKRYVREERS